MQSIYNFNGLQFLSEEDLLLKDYLVRTIALNVKQILKKQNQAWDLIQIEAPCLIPRDLVNQNYTDQDLWVQQSQNHSDLVLKPETTPATYEFMIDYFNHTSSLLPLAFWQVSKSFRREQDQPNKHCRFKEFYQQEFQCLYSKSTMNDYQANVIEDLAQMFLKLVGLPTRIVLSDRLPEYSLKTIDVEVFNGDKWMEICSVSTRKDFPIAPKIKNKEVECLVLEIAIGIDRLIYNIAQKNVVFDILKVTNSLSETDEPCA